MMNSSEIRITKSEILNKFELANVRNSKQIWMPDQVGHDIWWMSDQVGHDIWWMSDQVGHDIWFAQEYRTVEIAASVLRTSSQ